MFAIMLVTVGEYGVAALCIFLVVLFNLLQWRIENLIEGRVIIEASAKGIYFHAFNVYIPFQNVEGVFEATERSRGLKLVFMQLYFYVPYAQLSYLRKKFIQRLSWPVLVRQEGDRCLVKVGIPFTVGKGQPLTYTKQEIAETMNKLVANYKN